MKNIKAQVILAVIVFAKKTGRTRSHLTKGNNFPFTIKNLPETLPETTHPTFKRKFSSKEFLEE